MHEHEHVLLSIRTHLKSTHTLHICSLIPVKQYHFIYPQSESYFVSLAFRVHGTSRHSPRNLLVLDLPKACVDGLQRDAAEHALTPADFRWTVGFAEVETSEGKETKEITETET